MNSMKRIPKAVSQNIKGVAFTDKNCQILFHTGAASDRRLRGMFSDPDWIASTLERRIMPVQLVDQQFMLVTSPLEEGNLIVVFQDIGELALQFLLSVDFAFDLIEHLLSDPYEAMAISDSKGRLAFLSPVHQKFFKITDKNIVGNPIKDVVPGSRLATIVKTGVAEVGQLYSYNGRERVVSRYPVRRNGKVVGAFGRVMFKGPQQLEALSKRINTLEAEIATYRKKANENDRGQVYLDAIIGQSSAVIKLRDQIRKIAPLDIPVLIQGESGTGKELVAHALHMVSPRRDGRLVTVNAAALPAQLVESELFGYEAGSFTGADRKGKAGKFEQADKGTIFLDEIGDMPLEVQSKLLRVLQDHIVERVGGDKPTKVDFRLCSATNHDLEEFVESGQFRLDLFYRISPFIIHMPPLSERLEDIPLLVSHFLKQFADHYGQDVPEVDSDVMDYLMHRAWPGNLRELRHVIERAFVFCEDGRLNYSNLQESNKLRGANGEIKNGALRRALDQLEKEMIAESMTSFGGNKSKVANHLGVSRSYLYRKLEN